MSINEALLAELKQESKSTRKIIERLPDDKLSWAPHDKSMTLGRLATHIAELPVWVERVINANHFDFLSFTFKPVALESTAAILEVFDKRLEDAKQTLQNASDENLNAVWTLRRGEHVMVQLPRKVILRNLAYNHIYHHRGQLSVYLRLLNIPVPGMYGPSADEK